MRTFLVLCCCLVISGCLYNNQPENLLEEERYIDLLIELQLLRSYQKQLPDSTNIDSMKTVIFQKYQTTEAIFQENHSFYQQNIDLQSDRIKQAIERLRKDRLQPKDTTSTSDSIAAGSVNP